MKKIRIFLLVGVGVLIGFTLARNAKVHVFASASKQQQQSLPAVRVVDLKAPDGNLLKASYFAASKPGPAILLFHQNNRTRTSWDGGVVLFGPCLYVAVASLYFLNRSHDIQAYRDG